ncbi:hypothetical protein [Croceicoccus mobilis]|uniref:hypothetical protein n=1 Tax=Croceicoccus mobilis TaxID=1703339 RepID=UPI00155F6FB2|nr:hypothetical protein [Croceicoccus mobilis]
MGRGKILTSEKFVTNGPVPPEIWFKRLQWVWEKLNAKSPDSCEAILRHTFHLSQLAPGLLQDLAKPRVDEATFEVLIEAGSLEAASIGLLANYAVLTMSKSDGVMVKAIVALPALSVSGTATENDIARAVLHAWIKCHLAINSRYGASLETVIRPILQGKQFEQHPRPTEH